MVWYSTMFLHNVLLQTSNSLALVSTNCACFTTKTYADLVFVITRLATLVDWTSAGAGWRALCIFTMRVVGSLHPLLKEDFSSAFFGPNYKLFNISYLMTLIDVKIKLPRGARNCTAKILWNHLKVIPLKFYKLVGNSQPPGFRCHMSGIKGQVSQNFFVVDIFDMEGGFEIFARHNPLVVWFFTLWSALIDWIGKVGWFSKNRRKRDKVLLLGSFSKKNAA